MSSASDKSLNRLKRPEGCTTPEGLFCFMSSYSEKLKSPKWQRKRLEILNRDGFKCVLCNDEETTLHVHHKTYQFSNEPWEYDNSNLITLCEECHECIELERKQGIKFLPHKSYKSNTTPSIVLYYPEWVSCYWRSNDKFEFHTSLTNELILLLSKNIKNG